MPLSIEMGSIVSALEVLNAELFVIDIHKALRGHDKPDGMLFTSIINKLYHFRKTRMIHGQGATKPTLA